MLNNYPPPPVYHLACTIFMQAMDYLVWAALPGRRQQLIVGFGCLLKALLHEQAFSQITFFYNQNLKQK